MRILHLEESADDARVVAGLLAQEWPECVVEWVSEQGEFQPRLQSSAFSIVIADYPLGTTNGLSVLELARVWCPEKPFIFFSGPIGEERVVESLKRGATDYVAKDRPGRLVSAVRNALATIEEADRHRLTTEALRENRERFRQIAENVADLIVLCDPIGAMLYWNPAFAKAVGTSSELLGTDTLAWVHPGDRARVADIFRRTLDQGQPFRTEYRLCRNDGTTRYIEAQLGVIRDDHGTATHLLSVARDVTEGRAAHERIRQQAALLDKAQDAILVLDLADRVIFWNKGAERLFGWKAAEVLGKDGFELLGSEPESTAAARLQTYALGEWRGELRQRNQGREEVTVQSSWTLVRSDAGAAESVLMINTDVTERRRIEAQLLRSQRTESLGLLAGGVAHDLNNMLTPIITSAGLLKGCMKDEDGEQLVKIIDSSAKHGAALVRNLLAFARGAEGEHTEIDLEELVGDFIEFVRPALPGSISLIADIGFAPHVQADSTQLKQVLVNLCLNARDAMPKGGHICVALDRVELEGQALLRFPDARPGTYAQIVVSDTGVGIPADKIDRIFDPFFTTKESGKGTGLGLSTVRGIVKGHGGTMSVESTVGKGTTFRILLPQRPANTSPASQHEAPGAAPVAGAGILLVDDEPAVRLTLQLLLGASGYRVFAAEDGREALGIWEEHPSDLKLVITDIQMAGMDGLELIRALRERVPSLPIIAISGLAYGGRFDAPLEAAGVALLAKPIRRDDLLDAVRSALVAKAG